MKASKGIAIALVALAIVLTAIGGFADAYRGDGLFVISKQHAWHDGMFLLLLALFLVVAF